jgi:hypothetical protein
MLITATLLSAFAGPRAPLDQPNIVMLFVDDLGYGDVGFNGHPTTNTPNIDKLAWNGKVLTTWYSGCPVCSCSRASLMTGRQWSRMGIPGVFGPTVASGLPLNETTVADQLSQAGYATGAAGKWHLGQRAAYLPAARGFDAYLGIPYSDDMGKARATPCDSSGMRQLGHASLSYMAQVVPGEQPPGTTSDAVQETLAPYVEAGLAPAPGAAERGDPAGSFLPLVSQRKLADGSVNTTVLEQPLDFSTLSAKYAAFATGFVEAHADRAHTSCSNPRQAAPRRIGDARTRSGPRVVAQTRSSCTCPFRTCTPPRLTSRRSSSAAAPSRTRRRAAPSATRSPRWTGWWASSWRRSRRADSRRIR